MAIVHMCPECKGKIFAICVFDGSDKVQLTKGPKGNVHYGVGGLTGHHFHCNYCNKDFGISSGPVV